MAATETRTPEDTAHRPFRAWALQHDLISLLGGSSDWRVHPDELGLEPASGEDPVSAFNGHGFLREALATPPRLRLRTQVSLALWSVAFVTDALNQVSPLALPMPTGPFWLTIGLVAAALAFTAIVYPRLAVQRFIIVEQCLLTFASLLIVYQCSVTGGANSPYLYWFILTAYYAGYLMPGGQALLNLGWFSLLAAGTLLLNATDRTDSTLMLLFALLAVMWVVGIALMRQRNKENTLERAVRFLALADPLTSVANLRSLEQYLESLSRRDGQHFALVMVDMNGLKGANVVFGHETGDGMVVRLARLMLRASGPEDQVARIGGDEFAVVIPAGREGDLGRWRKEFEREVERHNAAVRGRLPQISVAIGTSLYPDDGVSATDLLDTADRRMYAEKPPAITPPYELEGSVASEAGRRFRAARFEDAPLRAGDVDERMRFAVLNWVTLSTLTFAVAIADVPGVHVAVAAACGIYALFWAVVSEFGRRTRVTRPLSMAIDVATLVFALPVMWASGGGTSPIQVAITLPVAFYAQNLRPRIALPRIAVLLASYIVGFWFFGTRGTADQTRFFTIFAGMLIVAGVMQYSGRIQSASLRVIRRSASNDRLTQLPNVYALRRDIDTALRELAAESAAPALGLIVVDIDDFRRANLLAGHRGGDAVLRQVAQRLLDHAGGGTVYRVEGDEFALLVRGLDERELALFTERCASAVAAVQRIDSSDIPIAACAGAAAWRPELSGDELVDLAETALAEEKARRRGDHRSPNSVLL